MTPPGEGGEARLATAYTNRAILKSGKQTCLALVPTLRKIALRENNIQGTPVDRYRLLTLRFGP